MGDRYSLIEKKIVETELINMKLKAINFLNFQSFESVEKNFVIGEVYVVEGLGYAIVTEKKPNEIKFITIVYNGAVWQMHWQDVDKHLEIKQGVYLDLIDMKSHDSEVFVKAFDPSIFKSIGNKDLVIKGKIYKN